MMFHKKHTPKFRNKTNVPSQLLFNIVLETLGKATWNGKKKNDI